jgi:hypothetical protein
MSKKSISLKLKYPWTDCKSTDALYVGKSAVFKTSKYQQDAIREYNFNTVLYKSGKPTQYGNSLQCFCRWQKATIKKWSYNTKYTFTQTGK